MEGRSVSFKHFVRVTAGLLVFFFAVAAASMVLSGSLFTWQPAVAASFQPEMTDGLSGNKRLSFLAQTTLAVTAATKSPSRPATLADFWSGKAGWVLETSDTGLPLGESDTINMGNGVFWSYLHASGQSAGVVDSCGSPAPFPGCVTRWVSTDGGQHFALAEPRCILACNSCPCDADDLVDQQQYPRVVKTPGGMFYMVFENKAATWFTSSFDGITWIRPVPVPSTGIWKLSYNTCSKTERIGPHPFFATSDFDCMAGGPPGLYITKTQIIIFVGLGQNPGHMGCFRSPLGGPYYFRRCAANPVFSGAAAYGPLDAYGAAANPYFDFRYVTSADVIRSGSYYYMSYEGIRGPSSLAGRDSQFALGFARSWSLDSAWEEYPGNPVLDNVADNWGIGHADLLINNGITYMYTGTPQMKRGRYTLAFK